jgi:demethylmenaquinone methyltransferase/2-methoxy-6-polyprenyl-1,4-benzoquinol methylase
MHGDEAPDESPDESTVAEYRWMAAIYDPVVDPFLNPVRRAVCDLAGQGPGRRVLDVACGTGSQLRMLAPLGFACTGVDLSSPMLAVARRKGPPSIVYRHEDARRTGLPDAGFDLAIIALSLHELPRGDQAAILAEIRRVVAPGGLLLAVDYLAPSPGAPGAPLRSRVGQALMRLPECMAGQEHYARFREFTGRGGLLALLADHGFPVLTLRPFLLGAVGLAACRIEGSSANTGG